MFRYRCESSSSRAGVYVTEVEGESLEQAQCYCQYMHGAEVISTSNTLLVTFVVENMDALDDYNRFFMRSTFRFIETNCADPTLGRGGGVVSLAKTRSGGCKRNVWSVHKV